MADDAIIADHSTKKYTHMYNLYRVLTAPVANVCSGNVSTSVMIL